MLRIRGDVSVSFFFFRLDGLERFLSGEVTFKLRYERRAFQAENSQCTGSEVGTQQVQEQGKVRKQARSSSGRLYKAGQGVQVLFKCDQTSKELKHSHGNIREWILEGKEREWEANSQLVNLHLVQVGSHGGLNLGGHGGDGDKRTVTSFGSTVNRTC